MHRFQTKTSPVRRQRNPQPVLRRGASVAQPIISNIRAPTNAPFLYTDILKELPLDDIQNIASSPPRASLDIHDEREKVHEDTNIPPEQVVVPYDGDNNDSLFVPPPSAPLDRNTNRASVPAEQVEMSYDLDNNEPLIPPPPLPQMTRKRAPVDPTKKRTRTVKPPIIESPNPVSSSSPKTLKHTSKMAQAQTKKRAPRKLSKMGINPKYVAPAEVHASVTNFPVAELYGHPNAVYYTNERRKFTQFITEKFMEYMSGPGRKTNLALRAHQQIVREYMNMYTPYRGILLYHGLGSGKTCASIAIAEGMKNARRVVLLTPASLKAGFFTELKNCGDDLYRHAQHWTFVPAAQITPHEAEQIVQRFQFEPGFVKKQQGVWITVSGKRANYHNMDRASQDSLNRQLDAMIRSKYLDINYNGLTRATYTKLTEAGNPFDHSTIVVDEAHNLVSRITNALNRPDSLAFQLYQNLLHAEDAKVVFLSGTPIINYAHEIAVLFNILRGGTKAWRIRVQGTYKPAQLTQMFRRAGIDTFQYVQFNNNIITVTRNPAGFVNQYKPESSDEDEMQDFIGVRYDKDRAALSDEVFIESILNALRQNNVNILPQGRNLVEPRTYYALPETAKEFNELYITENGVNPLTKNALKKRIVGLTSYYQSNDASNMPTIEKSSDGHDYHIVNCYMSDYQLGKYDPIRSIERNEESNLKERPAELPKKPTDVISSTYKIRSRLACNFVLPEGIEDRTDDEKKAEAEAVERAYEQQIQIDELPTGEDIYEPNVEPTTMEAEPPIPVEKKGASEILQKLVAMDSLVAENLSKYSPKMHAMLTNIQNNPDGCHLVYSFFRSLEGVGIFGKVLASNGFRPLEFRRLPNGAWDLKHDLDPSRPNYALYTGTESAEEREIVRNIQNSQWELLPDRIKEKLETTYSTTDKNHFGAALKCLLITSAAAEGINLKNILYVHLMEPYWNMGRLAQVIGRARRMNSHVHMPLDMRRIRVYLYMSKVYDEDTISDAKLKQLRASYTALVTKDIQLINNVEKVVSTDEVIYNIAMRKKHINDEILEMIQLTSIDCAISNKSGKCTSFGNVTTNEYGIALDYLQEDNLLATQQTKTARKIKYKDQEFLRIETGPGEAYLAVFNNPGVKVGTASQREGKWRYSFFRKENPAQPDQPVNH